jgi:hypothetical protein
MGKRTTIKIQEGTPRTNRNDPEKPKTKKRCIPPNQTNIPRMLRER